MFENCNHYIGIRFGYSISTTLMHISPPFLPLCRRIILTRSTVTRQQSGSGKCTQTRSGSTLLGSSTMSARCLQCGVSHSSLWWETHFLWAVPSLPSVCFPHSSKRILTLPTLATSKTTSHVMVILDLCCSAVCHTMGRASSVTLVM